LRTESLLDTSMVTSNLTRSPRVLLIEQQEVVSLVIAHILESNGFSVDIQKNGQGALRSAQEFEPDFIVSSLKLPDMNGPDVVREILANDNRRHAKPIFFCSESGTPRKDSLNFIEINGQRHPNLNRDCTRGTLLDTIAAMQN